MTDLIQMVKDYYVFRGLKNPDSSDALLFLISELGELAEAYIALCETGQTDSPNADSITTEELRVLEEMKDIGLDADNVVSKKKGWVRNNDRSKKTGSVSEAVRDEIGDTLMMLTVFSLALFSGIKGNPIEALMSKMKKKGFQVNGFFSVGNKKENEQPDTKYSLG